MADNMQYDLLIKNVQLVRPNVDSVEESDIAVKDGKIRRIGPGIDADASAEVYDGRDRLAFPGVVDAHMHTGIYSPLQEDAISENRAAAMGGVTTSLNYIRTGGYYLNKGGPYRNFFPEVLSLSKGRFHVDYAYHLAPMDRQHIEEIPDLIDEFGVTSFKIFMFYGGHGLHGRSSNQHKFLMIGEDERYDYAHFEFVMRGIQAALQKYPEKAHQISLSLHCETAEIMAAYTRIVEEEGRLQGLPAYHAARPPHSEGLAIFIASYLANETDLPNINLLHLSSRKALTAALQMAEVFPHINFRREVTIGHLMLDIDAPTGNFAKVNPPIRPRDDVEFLWQNLLKGKLDWNDPRVRDALHFVKSLIDAKALPSSFSTLKLGESHFYADMCFAAGMDAAPPPTFVSSIKIRAAGYPEVWNTEESFCFWLDDLIERRILPPRV